MTSDQIFILSLAALALVVAAGVFVVALRGARKTKAASGDTAHSAKLDRDAVKRDRAREREEAKVLETAGAPPVDTVEAPAPPPEPLPDPLEERPEVSEEEFGVTRRQFFNRAVLAVFGVFLAQFALGALAFMWPKLQSGGFGGKIDAGDADELLAQATAEAGRIIPVFVPAAQAYVIPFAPDDIPGSSFDDLPVEVWAGGLMALWQRCVHLGCRVPVCEPSQGFECPCHGSKYNFHGEYDSGPAPRNMDRFAVSINDANRFIVDTGTVVETARSRNQTIAYPQGPSCLSATE
jgi:cytochrome b6-f complex iron-sulfur subunit